MPINIIQADYQNPRHQQHIVELLDAYAQGPMGGSAALDSAVKANLIDNLIAFGNAFSLLAYAEDRAVALMNCVIGFSTFSAKPLVNIHDVYVDQDYRGQGISHLLMAKVEEVAKEMGCCKLTLEVLTNNDIAQASYRRFGFADYQLDPDSGTALFWQKKL